MTELTKQKVQKNKKKSCLRSHCSGLVGLIAYRYIVFLYINLMYFFEETQKWYPVFGEINNKNCIQD